jgi:DNA-binding MarR family transcriptional regulator
VTYGTKPYVGLPNFYKLTDQNLEYKDVIVYTALKWFNNDLDSLCFPRHDTVAKLAGVSKNFVIASIKRLELASVITVERSKQKHKSNYYYFAKPWRNRRQDKISKDFFKNTLDLTSHERAMLLCIRMFFDESNNECYLPNPVVHFAKWLGLTKDQVRKQFAALLKKDYIAEHFVNRKRSDKVRSYYKLTDKVDWDFSEYEWKVVPMSFNRYEPKFGRLKVA